MFVERPTPCLTAIAFDVKLLHPLQDVDTIFGNRKPVPVIGQYVWALLGLSLFNTLFICIETNVAKPRHKREDTLRSKLVIAFFITMEAFWETAKVQFNWLFGVQRDGQVPMSNVPIEGSQ